TSTSGWGRAIRRASSTRRTLWSIRTHGRRTRASRTGAARTAVAPSSIPSPPPRARRTTVPAEWAGRRAARERRAELAQAGRPVPAERRGEPERRGRPGRRAWLAEAARL